MNNCDNCLHYDTCKTHYSLGAFELIDGNCSNYDERTKWLHLPCKVGDDVYKLWYTECHLGETYPDSASCCGCEDECDMKRAIVKIKVPSIEFIVRELMKPNNSVYYLTHEEAERALKEKK